VSTARLWRFQAVLIIFSTTPFIKELTHMDLSTHTMRLSPREQPPVFTYNGEPGAILPRGVSPTLEARQSDTPLMQQQALPASDPDRTTLPAGQPSWLATATNTTSPRLPLLHKAVEGDASDTVRFEAAVSLHILARDLHDCGKLEEAQEGYREAIGLYQSVLGTDHAYIAIGHIDVGWLLSAQGKHELALDCFRKALAMQEKLYEPEHPYLTIPRNAINNLLRTLGKDQ
jgi:hypothetical protein